MLRTFLTPRGQASLQHLFGWLLRGAVICLILATSSSALAQESTPETDVIDVPVATEAPVPTAIPPTQIPPPTALPATEPPASEEPTPTQLPIEPTEVVSIPPTEPAAPDLAGEPTSEPTPTSTPDPVLSYSLAAQPDCIRDPEGPSAISSGGSLDYRCTDTVAITGTRIVPAAIDVTWITRAVVAGGWSVQLLPPANAAGEADWTATGQDEAWFSFEQVAPLGTATDASDLHQTIDITYRLRVHRTACGLQPETVRLSHDIIIHDRNGTAEVEPTLPLPSREPLRLTPALAAIPEPTLVLHGAPTFGVFEASSAGLVDSTSTGTMIVIVDGLDTACGDWQVRVASSAVLGSDDTALDDARLLVTAVNGQPLATGACDLIGTCTVAALAGSSTHAPKLTLTIQVDLVMPDFVPPGSFHMSFNADLRSVSPEDRIVP